MERGGGKVEFWKSGHIREGWPYGTGKLKKGRLRIHTPPAKNSRELLQKENPWIEES
jgi:hypothetical protein